MIPVLESPETEQTQVTTHLSPATHAPRSTSLPRTRELDFDGLVLICTGHTASRLVWAGCELNLFVTLHQRGALNLDELAAALSLERQPTRVLASGLCALKLIRKKGDAFENTPLATKYLIPGEPDCLVPLLGWQHHIVYPGLQDLVASLRENKNVGLRRLPGKGDRIYQRIASTPHLEKALQDAMRCLSGEANECVGGAAGLEKVRHLVDLGGGDGTNALRLTRQFKNLTVTVYDLPSVLERARDHVTGHPEASRIRFQPGNFLEDELPQDADAFFMGHVATIWSPERNQALLKKCYANLKPGGRMVLFNMTMNNQDDGPLVCALGSSYFQAIATGEGMLYSENDLTDWLQTAGFKNINSSPLPFEHRVITGVKQKQR